MADVVHLLNGEGWLDARVKCTGNMWRASGLTGSMRKEEVTCATCLEPKRASARAEPQPRTWSYEEIRAAFERNKEEL